MVIHTAVSELSQVLAETDGIAHGFFTRIGGVSEGIYASLNCGYGSKDDRTCVGENRRRVMAALGAKRAEPVTVYQVHGADVVEVDEPWPWDGAPKADGMVTRRPGLPLGIMTADCAPLLFADAQAGVVGAAHAGWRGARAGVAEATVAAMERLGAARGNIVVAVGPTIGVASYEVDTGFHQAFLADTADNAAYFQPGARDGHWLFDLPRYLVDRLERLGLAAVEHSDSDTYAAADRFFSYRRTTHAGEPDYARQLSTIMLA